MTRTTGELSVLAADLGPRDRLNQGANGTIYRLRTYQLSSDPGPLVFKEYRGLAPGSVSLAGLESIVGARLRMPPALRTVFDELTVWPLRAVVGDDGTPVGVLMRLISSDFMEEFALPSGRRDSGPREVQHLIFDAATARKRKVAVPADGDIRTRLTLCERLAYAVSIMHGAKLVYGDLSARNILYRLRPSPSVLLVDCDATRLHGNAAVNKQQDSPDWDPPETTAARLARQDIRQTQATDRYKLALFVLRCLTPGRGSSINRDWSRASPHLDHHGMTLLRTALDGPSAERPKAREWLLYLRSRLGVGPVPARSQPVPSAPRREVTNRGWHRAADGTWVPN